MEHLGHRFRTKIPYFPTLIPQQESDKRFPIDFPFPHRDSPRKISQQLPRDHGIFVGGFLYGGAPPSYKLAISPWKLVRYNHQQKPSWNWSYVSPNLAFSNGGTTWYLVTVHTTPNSDFGDDFNLCICWGCLTTFMNSLCKPIQTSWGRPTITNQKPMFTTKKLQKLQKLQTNYVYP